MNDGADNESDGLCDDGDPDDDNDGCDDGDDDDQMTWDDDYDSDGTPDDCDGDDDNDGAADGNDSDDNNEFVCHDDDGDGCDECASGTDVGTDSECDWDISIELEEGANLISFYALPNDVSVSNIFAGADGVIGEGVGAVNLNGTWIGSLTEVSQDGGYWVKTSSDISLDHSDAEPVNYDDDGEVVYDIHYGNNLISYSFSASQSIDDALGSAAANVYALAGQGVAALAINGNFVGSLTDFEGGNGYLIVAS
jgi:hypothetical protein